MAPDALDLRGKDDCLRAPHTCARVITQLGSSKKARLLRQQCDFLKVSRIDLLVAARLVDVEGRVNGDARSDARSLHAYAAVEGEIPTGFWRVGSSVALECSEREQGSEAIFARSV